MPLIMDEFLEAHTFLIKYSVYNILLQFQAGQ